MHDATTLTQRCDSIVQVIDPLLRGIARYKDGLKIQHNNGAGSWTENRKKENGLFQIQISPNMADYRILVGQSGRLINALRFVIKYAAIRHELKLRSFKPEEYLVRLNESYIGDIDEQSPDFQQNPEFDFDGMIAMLGSFLGLVYCDPWQLKMKTERRDDGKFKVFFDCPTSRDVAIVNALSDVFYPFGFRNGQIVEIRQSKQPIIQSERPIPQTGASEVRR